MPLRTETYDFEAEETRISERLQEIADEVVEVPDGSTREQELLQEGQDLDAQLGGVRWAQQAHEDDDVPAWGEDVDAVTLGGLTGGEFGQTEDDLAEQGGGGGATRVFLVANGTVDAPYAGDETAEAEALRATGSLPLEYLKWAEARVNELSGAQEGNGGKRFGDWLKEARKTSSTES